MFSLNNNNNKSKIHLLFDKKIDLELVIVQFGYEGKHVNQEGKKAL